MPEFRRDPAVGYWTIISEERGWRPMDTRPRVPAQERECPFCEGKESKTPQEVFAVRAPGTKPNGPGWELRAIPSQAPILSPLEEAVDAHTARLYDHRPGDGRHEVIVETPQHHHDLDEFPLSHLENVLKTYAARIDDFYKDPRIEYALLFKNHGLVSGAATDVIRHSRSQLIGLPIIPKRTKEELQMAKNYYEKNERCLFCDILKQESADGSRRVVENDSFFAYCPYASRSPFEMWILPKKHSADFSRLDAAAFPQLAWTLKQCLVRLRNLLEDPPYNIIFHTAPFRHKKATDYWKTIEVDSHWYLQIMPRLTMNAGFEWGTGIHINPTPPEEAAALLRDAEGEV